MTLDEDLSPSLGGDRAKPPEPAPEPAADGAGFEAAAPASELPDPFAELFEQVNQLASAFQALVETVETHLPPTIDAFSGLVDALGEGVARALSEDPPPPRA